MLFLLFQLEENRFMLDARQVTEVLPLVDVMVLPQSAPGVTGLFNYRGTLVPVLDLSQIVLGRPALQRLHTRILVVRLPGESGATQLVGLIVEKVTDTRRLDDSDFSAPGLAAPNLGLVINDRHGLAQRIEVEQLLPVLVRDLLRQPAVCG